jgi:hypothetical protein
LFERDVKVRAHSCCGTATRICWAQQKKEVVNMNWDERVKARAKARRERRADDELLFDEIVGYLRNYGGEEIQGLEFEKLPDGRRRGTKIRRGERVFSFRVLDNTVLVRAGNEASQEESFTNLGGAYDRMVDHMLDVLERWRAESCEAVDDHNRREPPAAPLYPA